MSKNNKVIVLALLALIVVVGASTVLLRAGKSSTENNNKQVQGSDENEQSSWDGGEKPSADLIAALKTLPHYPGITAEDEPLAEPVSNEGSVKMGVLGIYFTNDDQNKVFEFYSQAFKEKGWTIQQQPTSISDNSTLQEPATYVSAIYSDKDHEAKVTVGPNSKEKDPRGSNIINIALSQK